MRCRSKANRTRQTPPSAPNRNSFRLAILLPRRVSILWAAERWSEFREQSCVCQQCFLDGVGQTREFSFEVRVEDDIPGQGSI